MGAYCSGSVFSSHSSETWDDFLPHEVVLDKIHRHRPRDEVKVIASLLECYSHEHRSLPSSDSVAHAVHLWELCSPLDLAHLVFSHPQPEARLYAYEGLCVRLQNARHWKEEGNDASLLQELETLLFCASLKAQKDHARYTCESESTARCFSVSQVTKKLGWGLLSAENRLLLEDLLLRTQPDSTEAEQLLLRRSLDSCASLETYMLIETQVARKPHMLVALARFKKERDLPRIRRYLDSDQPEILSAGIRAVVAWPHPTFWESVKKTHHKLCQEVACSLAPPGSFAMTEATAGGITTALERFYAIHEALGAFQHQLATKCFDHSYQALHQVTQRFRNSRISSAVLTGFLRFIPMSLAYAPLFLQIWKQHGVILPSVLDLLLDVSGEEERQVHASWMSFLMGTHERVGDESAVRILTHQKDVLYLIHKEIPTFRRESALLLSDPMNPAWYIGRGCLCDRGTFARAFDAVLAELSSAIACTLLEHFVKICTCHDASFVCEYTVKLQKPSQELQKALLDKACHWNFYVHDPARMALLCMNDPAVDKQLEEVLQEPLSSLTVYNIVTEGSTTHRRRWRAFL